MIRAAAFSTVTVWAGVAGAHPGHLAEAQGHSHWEMLAGLLILGLAATAIWARARR